MTFTTFPFDDRLDVSASRGQRVDHFRFELINGVENSPKKFLQPTPTQPPSLTHDTTNGIKRRLSLSLGVDDTADIDPITDRILPQMITGGKTYPLGRYMFTNETDALSTGGSRGGFTLVDEGFVIDQAIEKAITGSIAVRSATKALLEGLPLLGFDMEASSFLTTGAFSPGQTRGQILEAWATQGDYFSYWMGNNGFFRMIRVFDPATRIPDFDYDVGKQVLRDSITRTNDVLNAPNRFVVIANSATAAAGPIAGKYDVPSSAPHSIQNRGFVIPQITDLQVHTSIQAAAAARNIGIRATVFDRISLNTANDPRHDSYNVIHFLGSNWLELSWSMTLVPGGTMSHTMRKAYT